MSENSKILSRPLGKAEKGNWLGDLAVCSNFVVTAEIAGKLDESSLRKAWESAQRRHPMLRVRIKVGEKNKVLFEFVKDQSIPLLIHDDPSGKEWLKEAERSMNSSFDIGSYPLSSITWYRQNERESAIVMKFNHAIGDAKSAALLLMDILKNTQDHSGTSDFDESPGILPPLEDLYPPQFQGAWARIKANLFLLRLSSLMLRPGVPGNIPNCGPPATSDRPIRLVPLELDEKIAASLLDRCRQEKTTIHGAMLAAQMLAFRSEFESKKKITITITSAVNLRKRLEPMPKDSDLCYYVGMILNLHKLGDKENFWEVARDARSLLMEKMDRGEAHLLWLAAPPDFLFPPNEVGARRLGKFASKLPVLSLVTNIGNISSNDKLGSLQIKSMRFALGTQAGVTVVSAVSSIGGRIYINCAFDASRFPEERCAVIAKNIENFILKAL